MSNSHTPLRVVVAAPLPGLEVLRERLTADRFEFIVADHRNGELRSALGDADALVCFRLDPTDTTDARKLRFVQGAGTGFDLFDMAALPRGCVLCNASSQAAPLAEWSLWDCSRRRGTSSPPTAASAVDSGQPMIADGL